MGWVAATLVACAATEWKSGIEWPEPKIVTPGVESEPPSDAIVLFDGKDMSQWVGGDQWKVEDGYVVSQNTDISSKQAFGDCQLHVEFATPEKVSGTGQFRGNSGIYLMSAYELQVLDSYDNPTYYDGQCGSLYKQKPPMVNVCRKPGEWQSYDIVFMAPKFDTAGKLTQPATITVFQNGVLIQNHYELLGATFWEQPPKYTAHADKMPLMLQSHHDVSGVGYVPVRYRNIWIREL